MLPVSLLTGNAFAQNLPAGTGLIAVGGRQYVGDPVFYDQSGQASSLGAHFNSDFNSDCMSSGKCGTDLKKLYDNIKKYDTSAGSSQQSIADQLTLGSQRGTVKSDLSVKAVGLGFGLSDKITVFAIVPIIKASLDADIDIQGENNAAAIKAKLGDAAFDDLKAGLDQASHLSRASILSKITDEYQYQSIDHWEYNGIGDIAIGARTGWKYHGVLAPRYTLGLTSQMNFPTGPQYDPDSLAQMSLSRGYKSIDLLTDHRLAWKNTALGSELGGGVGIPQDTVRRVPVGDEELIAPDRKSLVHIQPGIDTKAAVYGIVGNTTYRGQYKLGVASHHADTFSGSLAGNYGGMGQKTVTNDVYQEATLIYTTTKSYKQKKSLIPLLLSLTARNSLAGLNTTTGKSFELSLMTFFSTPMNRTEKTLRSRSNGYRTH
jgi:hypothetical protein